MYKKNIVISCLNWFLSVIINTLMWEGEIYNIIFFFINYNLIA